MKAIYKIQIYLPYLTGLFYAWAAGPPKLKGISTASFHPGNVATNFASGSKGLIKFLYHGPFKKIFGLVSPEKGADNMIWLATSEPIKEWTPGEYYIKHKVGKAIDKAYDPELARSLWEQSVKMTRI